MCYRVSKVNIQGVGLITIKDKELYSNVLLVFDSSSLAGQKLVVDHKQLWHAEMNL